MTTFQEEKQSLHEMKRRLDEERRSIGSDHPPNVEDDFSSRHVNKNAGDIHREPPRYDWSVITAYCQQYRC